MKSLAFSRLEGKVEIVYPVNKSFGAAKDAWIATWLRHLNAKLVVAVARSFNQRDHKAKGQLRGWKKWETLQRETGLSEDTVWRFFKKAEQMGSLDIEHGRYDPVKKRRDYNRYQARCPNMSGQTNPAPVRKSNPAPVREYSLKEDYLTKYSSAPSALAAPQPSAASPQGNPRKEGQEEQREPLAASDGPLWGEGGVEHENGGSARRMVTIKRDSIEMWALLAHPAREKYARCGGLYAALVPADEWGAIWSAYESKERKTA